MSIIGVLDIGHRERVHLHPKAGRVGVRRESRLSRGELWPRLWGSGCGATGGVLEDGDTQRLVLCWQVVFFGFGHQVGYIRTGGNVNLKMEQTDQT